MYKYGNITPYGKAMRCLRKGFDHGLAKNQAPRKIQSNREKKKIPKLAVGTLGIGQKGQGLRQMHQEARQKKIIPI